MNLYYIVYIIGCYLLFTGLLDAYKYHWQSQSIRKVRIAKGHSRKFVNAAIHNNQIRILYLIISGVIYKRIDWFLLIGSLIAMIYMVELWFTIYLFYPYRMRGCNNFRKPNIVLYTINSIIPNRIRKRL